MDKTLFIKDGQSAHRLISRGGLYRYQFSHPSSVGVRETEHAELARFHPGIAVQLGWREGREPGVIDYGIIDSRVPNGHLGDESRNDVHQQLPRLHRGGETFHLSQMEIYLSNNPELSFTWNKTFLSTPKWRQLSKIKRLFLLSERRVVCPREQRRNT